MKTRSQQYQLSLGNRRSLTLTLRKFRVASNRRSQKNRAIVLNVHMGPVRQLVIEYKRRRPVGRPKLPPQQQLLRLRVITPIACVAVGVAGFIFFASQLVTAKSLLPAQTFSQTISQKATPRTLPASQPTHISIPAVAIDADIIPVGLDSNGSIELPPALSWQAGWYQHSPTPGQLGPAIIVGHVDNYQNISVFWRLRYVKPGDKIIISRADGKPATFTITALDQYDQQSFPTNKVYGNLDYAGLKLITCGGNFDEQTHHYSQNTVVTARLVM